MTATLSGSSAALKILYPKGELPKVVISQFKTLEKLKKPTDFVGESQYVALQNENPQGSSSDFATALGSLQQGVYNRFNLTRVQHFGIARVTGQAAEAAVKNEGALVDLWDNETRGISMTELKGHAIYLFGQGDGNLGTISSGQTGVTLTMTSSTNMNYFDLGARLGAVDVSGLSPTVRSGFARVTGIDRKGGTLTTGTAWNSQITGLASTDILVRAGDAPVGGAATVITGLAGYVVGGSSPGTLFGLNRNSDPVRLAGQTASYAGVAMEDAIVDASGLAGFQGVGYPDTLIANNRDIANMKKSMAAKIIYDRNGSSSGGVSFSKVTVEGENGPIEVISDPFCPRNTAYLLKLDAFALHSLKAAPHLQNYDNNNFLRVANDDAFEVRFVSYANLRCQNPAPHVKLTSFGS